MLVTIEPPNPQWTETFHTIKASLQTTLRAVPILAIEHIGSTCVPNLPAKPIIDIDIITSRSNLPPTIQALELTGYKYIGERGIPDRHAVREPGLGHTCNTYICIEGCLAVRNHIGIRDLLRRDPEWRDEYARVKLALAERDFEDVDAYAEAKTEVLQKLLVAAGGIGEEEMAAIEAVNQRAHVVLHRP